jgi:hypothetical protein
LQETPDFRAPVVLCVQIYSQSVDLTGITERFVPQRAAFGVWSATSLDVAF